MKSDRIQHTNYDSAGIISPTIKNPKKCEVLKPNTVISKNKLIKNPKLHKDANCEDEEDNGCCAGVATIKTRKYYFSSVCNLCRKESATLPCSKCKIIYYCSAQHADSDYNHSEFCETVQKIAHDRGGHIYNRASAMSFDDFRTYRVVTLNSCQSMLMNQLTADEKEAILFPKLCSAAGCREFRNSKLENCKYCEEVAFCRENPEHYRRSHLIWCNFYSLLKRIHLRQERNGVDAIRFANTVLTEKSNRLTRPTIEKVFKALHLDTGDEISTAMCTLAASGPLTSWYALKLTSNLANEKLVVHVIGAEMEFELDLLNKWECFFMHLMPQLKHLTLQFVGPELNYSYAFSNNSIDLQLCRQCKNHNRSVKVHFEKVLYHEFCSSSSYIKPSLVCFFNPGLYRSTGFQNMDTWPATIKDAAKAVCPIVITSYTHYESPLDLRRFLNYSNRSISIVQPPTVNIFKSGKPERNFISDEAVPLIFKNFYSFVLQ